MLMSDLVYAEQEALDYWMKLARRIDTSNPVERETLHEAVLTHRTLYRLLESKVGHIDPMRFMKEV